MQMDTVNQQFIADKLNISRSTVSRCFTNHPGINPVTRARVFKLASRLGYQHLEMRTGGGAKKKAGQKTIGVLFCADVRLHNVAELGNPGLQLFAGISEFTQIHKHKIELHYVDWKETALDLPSYAKIEALQRRLWDGVILIYSFPREIVDELNIRFPMVSLVEQYGTESCNCVDVDHYKGISTIMKRLFEMGHRRIGFYNLKYPVENEWSLRRYCAYVEELTRAGLPLIQEDVLNIQAGHFLDDESTMDRAVQQIKKGVTAWLCAADHQAYELIAGLNARGLQVPDDVSITGFDGVPRPALSKADLTTVVAPYHQIGFTGAKRVFDLVNKRSGMPQHILVALQLREGKTVKPVRL